MYPEYGSLKSGHQAHFYGRMCAKSSCIWQCRGRHLVLAAASPNAMPGHNFSGFCCNTENGPQIAGFGASRAAKNVVASPRHHICPRPLMAFASSNVFTAQSVQHAIKLIEIENMSMNYQQLPKSWVVAVMCYCFLHEMHIAHALVTYTAC